MVIDALALGSAVEIAVKYTSGLIRSRHKPGRGRVAHFQRSLRAPFPLRVPHPCVFCKGGQRCCVRYLIFVVDA
jgi:hypothetical protein